MGLRNKKGIIFTTLAIILSAVLLLMVSVQNQKRTGTATDAVSTRILSMNNAIIDIEEDLSKGMSIIGYNTLLAVEDHIGSSGLYVSDLDTVFKDAFLYSTINNSEVPLLINNSFLNWSQKIAQQEQKIGIELNLTVINVSLLQEGPWEIIVKTTIGLFAVDKKGTAGWDRNVTVFARFDIQYLEDPLYTIGTYGRVPNQIIRANSTNFGNLTILLNHINNSYYKESPSAPSFLMRLQGDFGPSPYGIESIVNLDKIAAQQLPIADKSTVDYLYFGTTGHTVCTINQTAATDLDWFALDNGAEPQNHLDDYDADCEE